MVEAKQTPFLSAGTGKGYGSRGQRPPNLVVWEVEVEPLELAGVLKIRMRDGIW
jgi:hypothetical protein